MEFYRLWGSTEAFHQRFNLYPPETFKALRVLAEEHYEVTEAALVKSKDQLAEEGADLVVTLMGVLMSRGVSIDDFEKAMSNVANKNDAKTFANYEINSAGKISRKSKIINFKETVENNGVIK